LCKISITDFYFDLKLHTKLFKEPSLACLASEQQNPLAQVQNLLTLEAIGHEFLVRSTSRGSLVHMQFLIQCSHVSLCRLVIVISLIIQRVLWEGKRPGTKDAILFFGFDEVCCRKSSCFSFGHDHII